MSKKKKQKKNKKMKCLWGLNKEHDGCVCNRQMFPDANGQMTLQVPVCAKHFKEHNDIMLLYGMGIKIKTLVNRKTKWRTQKVKAIRKLTKK